MYTLPHALGPWLYCAQPVAGLLSLCRFWELLHMYPYSELIVSIIDPIAFLDARLHHLETSQPSLLLCSPLTFGFLKKVDVWR